MTKKGGGRGGGGGGGGSARIGTGTWAKAAAKRSDVFCLVPAGGFLCLRVLVLGGATTGATAAIAAAAIGAAAIGAAAIGGAWCRMAA